MSLTAAILVVCSRFQGGVWNEFLLGTFEREPTTLILFGGFRTWLDDAYSHRPLILVNACEALLLLESEIANGRNE